MVKWSAHVCNCHNGRNCHLRKEVQLRGVFRFSEIIAIIVSCGRRSVEMGRSNE
jgi:hypothetical protein